MLLRQGDGEVVNQPEHLLTTYVLGKFFQSRANEFFQNNHLLLPHLLEYALKEASNLKASYLVDAFCGCGLFAICAAHLFEKVWGVEINARSIQQAHSNAAANHLKNVSFILGDVDSVFEHLKGVDADKTSLLLDPPRAGCSQDFLKQLLVFCPKSLIYVSCQAATQARDVAYLSSHYHLKRLMPFDCFPQTRHIETVATLIRNKV